MSALHPLGLRQCIHCLTWRRHLDSDGWCDTCVGVTEDQSTIDARLLRGLHVRMAKLQSDGKHTAAAVTAREIERLSAGRRRDVA